MSKIKQTEYIEEIMTEGPKTIGTDSKISDIANTFESCNFRHLPVVSGKKLVGMFSYGDFLKLDYSTGLNQDSREVMATLDSTTTPALHMAKKLVTLGPRSLIKEAATILCEGNFHSIPIVDDKAHLVGIVTTTDIIRYFMKAY